MLEVDGIMYDEVKRSMKKEYIRRVKKILFLKLNGSVIKIINSWVVFLDWDSRGILNWIKSEFVELDYFRKLLIIYGVFYFRFNVSCLYLLRREGGCVLIIVEDVINIEERNINVYIS